MHVCVSNNNKKKKQWMHVCFAFGSSEWHWHRSFDIQATSSQWQLSIFECISVWIECSISHCGFKSIPSISSYWHSQWHWNKAMSATIEAHSHTHTNIWQRLPIVVVVVGYDDDDDMRTWHRHTFSVTHNLKQTFAATDTKSKKKKTTTSE